MYLIGITASLSTDSNGIRTYSNIQVNNTYNDILMNALAQGKRLAIVVAGTSDPSWEYLVFQDVIVNTDAQKGLRASIVTADLTSTPSIIELKWVGINTVTITHRLLSA